MSTSGEGGEEPRPKKIVVEIWDRVLSQRKASMSKREKESEESPGQSKGISAKEKSISSERVTQHWGGVKKSLAVLHQKQEFVVSGEMRGDKPNLEKKSGMVRGRGEGTSGKR